MLAEGELAEVEAEEPVGTEGGGVEDEVDPMIIVPNGAMQTEAGTATRRPVKAQYSLND